MKFAEFYDPVVGKERLEQLQKQSAVTLEYVLEHAEEMTGKAFCLIGNYEKFDTEETVVRKFVLEGHKWKVSDICFVENFKTDYYHTFTSDEVRKHPHFVELLAETGYICEN